MNCLIKKLNHYILLILVALGVMGLPICGFAADVPSPENQLIGLINQARSNPMQMVEKVGADADRVLECFKDRQEILLNGLRSLSVNQRLMETASAHTSEMLEFDNYTKISVDGRRPVERIAAAGYNPLITGESIGIIGFNNLMPRDRAVWELFKNMFLDELRCGGTDPWHILSPEFSEIGVRVAAGTMRSGDKPINIYIAACDFGTSKTGIYAAERNLLQLINLVRSYPGVALSYLGIDIADAFESLGRDGWVLLLGLSPVSASEQLFAAADDRVDGFGVKLANGGLAGNENMVADVQSLLLSDYAYGASSAFEVMVVKSFDDGRNPIPGEGIFQIFHEMLSAELTGKDSGRPLTVFNAALTEMGIGYRHISRTNAAGAETYYGLLVSEFAQPVVSSRSIIGQVTWGIDNNIDGEIVETANEDTNGLLIQVFEDAVSGDDLPGGAPLSVAFTDPVGGYSIALPYDDDYRGKYRLTITEPYGKSEKSVLFTESFFHNHKRNLLKNIDLKESDPIYE